jgi:glycyl-tRNA synthetase
VKEFSDLALRRGFIYPSCEIYGGVAGFYDYGPLGTLLKRNWENLWRTFFMGLDSNFFEIQTCDIMASSVFEASGHIKNFNDPLINCLKCGKRLRPDHLLEERGIQAEGLTLPELDSRIAEAKIDCPYCKGTLSQTRLFNMMFDVKIGASEGEIGYLRPETAQGAYVSFKRLFEVCRNQLPLGLAILGRAYRNEISPRQGFYRLRELNQAELQIFFDPETVGHHKDWDSVKDTRLKTFSVKDREHGEVEERTCEETGLPQFYAYHLAKIQEFYLDVLRVPKSHFRFRELSDEEKAFYNKVHWDVEVCVDSLGGFKELGGLHYRTDHDLKGHQAVSKESMEVNIEGKKFVPHVLELSFGIDRNFWAMMDLAYDVEKERTVMRFPDSIAPYRIAVFPLMKKDGLYEKAWDIYQQLRSKYVCDFDEKGSIGKRYRRHDEIGTPYCVTVDYQTLNDDTVTLRFRDSMEQVRVKGNEIQERVV